MPTELRLDGLEELKAALMRLPDDLKAEAAQIVTSAAADAKRDTQIAYPLGRTGNLRNGVTMAVESSTKFGVAARVKSNAKHVHLYEDGSVPRRTKSGANRGQMPRASEDHRMIPVVIRARRQMVANLIAMLQRHGLVVTT